MEDKWIQFYDYYEVSNTGKLRSINRWIERPGYRKFHVGRLLSVKPDENGFFHFVLFNNLGKSKSFYLHRLVMKYFGPKRPYKHFINFIDGDRNNVAITNLEWKSRIDAFIENNQTKLDWEKVYQIRNYLKQGYTCQEIANYFGVARSIISNIKHEKSWRR